MRTREILMLVGGIGLLSGCHGAPLETWGNEAEALFRLLGKKEKIVTEGDLANGRVLQDIAKLRDQNVWTLCEKAKTQEMGDEWAGTVAHYAKRCTNIANFTELTETEATQLLVDPQHFLNDTRMCNKTCVDAMDSKGKESLVSVFNGILFRCTGVLSPKGARFKAETILTNMDNVSSAVNMTWKDVIMKYDTLRNKARSCLSDLDNATKAACEPKFAELDTLKASNLGKFCAETLKNMTEPEDGKKFCMTKAPGTNKHCFAHYRMKIKGLVTAGCAKTARFLDEKRSMMGVCARRGQTYCYPKYKKWEGRSFRGELDALILAGNLSEARALGAEMCGDKCVRKIAKVTGTFSPLAADMQLVCKKKKGEFCYETFVAGMKITNQTEKIQKLCKNSCFKKIAVTVMNRKETPPKITRHLGAISKYLCLKQPKNNHTEIKNCIVRTYAAYPKYIDSEECKSAWGGTACSEACKSNLTAFFAETGCCANATLEYTWATSPDDNAEQDSRGKWTNITTTCDVPIPNKCVIERNSKKKKHINMCGVTAEWLNKTENKDALSKDLQSSLGLTEENIENLEVKNSDKACAGTGTGARRRLQDTSSSSEIVLGLQAQDETELNDISTTTEDDLEFGNVFTNLVDENPDLSEDFSLSSEELTVTEAPVAAPTTRAPTSAPTAPTAPPTTASPGISDSTRVMFSSLLFAFVFGYSIFNQ
mmetsp:Transcript_4590/g.8016  ORF Transcript_4590/g.8016 Transcript_4590/m.8016 type:complete len:709 (-) Transcript_4590:19-2145(-)